MYFEVFLVILAIAFGWVKWEEIPSDKKPAKAVTLTNDFKMWEDE